MGLINHNEYVLSNGIGLVDTYICVSNNTIRIQKIDNGLYRVDIPYHVFKNIDARNNDLSPLTNNSFSINVDSSTLNQNVYTLCYEELKNLYPNYSDVL